LLVERYLQHFIYRLQTKMVFGWAMANTFLLNTTYYEENKNAKNKK
jgi:hypothetical protein